MGSFDGSTSEQRELQNKIEIENKIKEGAENLLHVFDLRLASSTKHDLRKQIESELDTANAKIAALRGQLQRLNAAGPSYRGPRWQRDSDGETGGDAEAETDPVSRLEASALGLEHQSLFPGSAAGPSRLPDTATKYQVSRMQDAFGTGSPPSTNLVNEIGTPRNMDSLVGGLGIGLDGGFDTALDPSRLRFQTAGTPPMARSKVTLPRAQSEADVWEQERENDDALATRTLVTALIRSLRTTPSRNRSGSAPLLMSGAGAGDDGAAPHMMTNSKSMDSGGGGADSASGLTSNGGATNPSMALPVGAPPSRLNRRQIARSRVAALAYAVASGHVRTPSNAYGLGDAANRRIDTMKRLVNVLKKHARVRYELSLDELVEVVMPCLADSAGKEVRAAAYRLVRHSLIQPPWPLVSRCRSRGLDVYLSRTLVRDSRFDVEREQALKLIRTIMELSALRTVNAAPDRLAPDLQDLLAPGVVRAMAAVAEDGDDKLRHICLETLAELAVFDVRLLIKGGGLRSALQALVEAPNDFAPTLMQTFLYLIDMPGTRAFLRPGIDLEVAISGLTDSLPIKPVGYEASLRSTAKVVSTMLRSWGGLLYMCMDNCRAVKSIVLALRVNQVEVKDCILDMLYDLFNVRGAAQAMDPASKRESGQRQAATAKQGAATPATADGDGATSTTSSAGLPSLGEMGDQSRTRLNLVDHYLSLLLVVFIEAGLVDALVDVIEHAPQTSRKATLLMGELLQVSKRVHPPSIGSSIHSLPHLFSLAARFKTSKSDERQAAALALSSIDRVNRQRAHHEAITTVAAVSGSKQPASRDRSNSLEETVRRGQRQVEKTKIRLGMQIDDNQFRSLMVETQILNTKDHAKWNLDTLTELLEGPLMNPRRMDEAIRGTKFLRRLLSFFHPFSLRFSSIRRISSNRRFVKLGCTLMSTLVCTAEGTKALAEDRLLREIRECLEQLDPVSGTPISDPLMSKSRLEETLTSGYFEMLGVLTQTTDGIRILEKHKIFSPLYHLSELRSRDDIIRAVIENFDYAFDGHTRVVLSKALTSNYRHVRLFATCHLADLLRKTISSGAAARSSAATAMAAVPEDDGGEWMINLLLSQLYDTSVEVRELAVKVVEESCASIEVLEKVVAMRPTLDHLGDIGHPLLLKFLSTSIGFRYLWHGDYIDREMDHWFNERNHRYTIQVEVMLASFFSVFRASAASQRPDTRAGGSCEPETDGTVPSHFYGELAKTAEGCEILRQKGHFGEFAHFIRQHGLEHSDAELINKLKSVLWAVGNIGSAPLGLPFLEDEDVVSQIVEIAENSLVMSVRGTCFFVLGLISATTPGSEILLDYGWVSVCTPLGVPLGLCLPNDVGRLVSIPSWAVPEAHGPTFHGFLEPETMLENKIITSIANLGNSILAGNASRSLAKLKLKHKSAFEDVGLLTRAVELMDSFYFRLSVRRYIWELFDVSLGEETIEQLQMRRAEFQARRDELQAAGKSATARSTPHRRPTDGQRKRDESPATRTRDDKDPPLASTLRALRGISRVPLPGLKAIAGDESDEDARSVDYDSDLGGQVSLGSTSQSEDEDAQADGIAGGIGYPRQRSTSHGDDVRRAVLEAQTRRKAFDSDLDDSLQFVGTAAVHSNAAAISTGTIRGATAGAAASAGANLPLSEPPKLAMTPKRKVTGFAL